MSKRRDRSEESDLAGYKKQRVGTDPDALLDLAIKSLQDLQSWKENFDIDASSSSPFPAEKLGLLRKVSQDVLSSLKPIANAKTPAADPQPHPLNSPWVSSEITDDLPPLPPVKDPKLEAQVFRHPANAINGEPSYERLEFLGDAYLEAISSSYILATFPDLPSGRCAQIRERLIRNTELASYCRKYDLMDKATVPSEVRGGPLPGKNSKGRSQDKDIIKVQADVFEAYVGAVITENPETGIQTVSEWMKRVWGNSIRGDVTNEERRRDRSLKEQAEKAAFIERRTAIQADIVSPEKDTAPENKTIREDSTKPTQDEGEKPNPMFNPSTKSRLGYAVMLPGVQLKYEDEPCNQVQHGTKLALFAVKVSIWGYGETDLLLGRGTALKKKEAGANAAKYALEDNWKLTSTFRDRKRLHLQKTGQTEDAELLMSRTRHLDERKR